ncbi:unnamed protein product [Ectocarpus sp. 6 AP-2014]
MPRTCGQGGCSKLSGFGDHGGRAEYCSKHKKESMVNVKCKRCRHPRCSKMPSFLSTSWVCRPLTLQQYSRSQSHRPCPGWNNKKIAELSGGIHYPSRSVQINLRIRGVD